MIKSTIPRVVTTHVDFADEPQSRRIPGQVNEMAIVLGRIPVPHAHRPPRTALRASLDQVVDWFWFVAFGAIFLGVPLVGILAAVFD